MDSFLENIVMFTLSLKIEAQAMTDMLLVKY